MAVISMDVEDWYHLDYFDRRQCNCSHSALDGVDVFRDLLKFHGIRCSFFVLGELVRRLGSTLKELLAEGHDIASHGWDHGRPLKLSHQAFKKDLERSKFETEEVVGVTVAGYRAPCFSLDRDRLAIVQEVGFAYDSSRIVFAGHPLYGALDLAGFEEVSKNIFRRDAFFEFEVSTLGIGAKSIPVCGGGYLRIFPWFLMRYLIQRYIFQSSFYVLYIHPFELSIRAAPRLPKGTKWLTGMRFRFGRGSVILKLLELIHLLRKNGFEFTTFAALRQRLLHGPRP